MKRISNFIIFLSAFIAIQAADFTGIKIYINPGHGGWDANDRNLPSINFNLGDTLGFYESKSNLIKGLHLRDMLQQAGATVYMSRTLNRTQDDLPLSQIAAEANANNVDAFVSIHSNAVGTNVGTNYLLLLFHGRDNSPKVAQSLPMCQTAWPRLMSNKLTVWTHYTTSTNIRGDSTFYGTYGLGVLTPLIVPGFLSEGSFHDYHPETHRLLNPDYCKNEAINLYRYFCDYFKSDLPATGDIAGFVKGKDQRINHARYVYKAATEDQWLPLNGSRVKLMNASGDSLTQYQVDTLNNGLFAFRNLQPGNYKLRFFHKNHTTKDTAVSVVAATTTYAKMMLVNPNIIVPKDTTPDYPNPVQEAGIVPLPYYKFGNAVQAIPEWINQYQIKKILYRNEKYYVLTHDAKVLVVNALTNAFVSEMKLTNISGGVNTISDIAFTSDGFLLACNKDTIGLPETKNRFFRVYTWDDDNADPKLLFQTQQQGNWSNGVMGETMAVSGPRWKCRIYTPSVTTSISKAIRIVGLQYEEGLTVLGYKYMLEASTPSKYSEALWGKKLSFQVSPTGPDHFYLDSEILLPTEFQFDWSKPDRDPLINKGIFSEKNGFTLQAFNAGSFYFRHAKKVMMATPVCNADSTGSRVLLFDITDGLNKAVKISDPLPGDGLTGNKAPFICAAAKVSGYDVELMVIAQNQGIGRYKTIAPTAKANVYATRPGMAIPTCDCPAGNFPKLTFELNTDATNVIINILKDGNIVKQLETGAFPKGYNMYDADLRDLPEGDYSWSLTAIAENTDRPLKFSDNTQPQLQFYSPRGVAVDNNPESLYFGNIYVSETVGGTVTNRTTKDGIYILNPALQGGNTSYAGGISWGGAGSPMRVAVAENGEVYLTDWSDTNPGVWIMNPALPSQAFRPVFSELTKATNGLSSFNGVNVHGSISHCWVTGKGENTRLFTFDQDYTDATATNTGNLLQYNIGTLQAPWQSAPSAIVYNDALNGNLQQNFNSCIVPDGRGGWWISQHRAEDAATIPSLIHVGADGLQNFNSGKTPLLIGNSVMAGMAVNSTGNIIAMGCKDEVRIFAITYNASNVPTLTMIHDIKPAMGTNTVGLAFDCADNLYVLSNSSERLGVWSLPKTSNSYTTPAPDMWKIKITSVETTPENKPEIRIYPNPAEHDIQIESSEIMQQVELIDLRGQMIQRIQPESTSIQLELNNLNAGTYILRVKTKQGEIKQKFIKK